MYYTRVMKGWGSGWRRINKFYQSPPQVYVSRRLAGNWFFKHTFHIDKPLDYTLYANANVFDNRPNQ